MHSCCGQTGFALIDLQAINLLNDSLKANWNITNLLFSSSATINTLHEVLASMGAAATSDPERTATQRLLDSVERPATKSDASTAPVAPATPAARRPRGERYRAPDKAPARRGAHVIS